VSFVVDSLAASDVTLVATSAVAAAGAIAAGLLGHIYAERRENRQRDLERRDRRREEMRTLLDESGAALEEALPAFDRRRVAQGEDARREAGIAFDDWVSQVRQRENQLAVRLSRDDPFRDVLTSYHRARKGLEHLAMLVYEAGEDPPPDDKVGPARGAVLSARDEFLEQEGRYFQAEGLGDPGAVGHSRAL
jgi:hypothetical protein